MLADFGLDFLLLMTIFGVGYAATEDKINLEEIYSNPLSNGILIKFLGFIYY